MSVFRSKSLEELKDFANQAYQLGIIERDIPDTADAFFEKLLGTPFELAGKVRKECPLDDIRKIVEDVFADEIRSIPFYKVWLQDMAETCKIFCEIQKSEAISFWLGTNRGCTRYHVDNVPLRLLVTYAGKGTEWMPDEAADRYAYENGEPNEKILKDSSALQFMNQWDISLFRGGSKGLLHRTPDAALNGPSILMRLDHSSFWKSRREYEVIMEPLPA